MKHLTGSPTNDPTSSPTESLTKELTGSPTRSPTKDLTGSSTDSPMQDLTSSSTGSPTNDLTGSPTGSLTKELTGSPTHSPTTMDAPFEESSLWAQRRRWTERIGKTCDYARYVIILGFPDVNEVKYIWPDENFETNANYARARILVDGRDCQ